MIVVTLLLSLMLEPLTSKVPVPRLVTSIVTSSISTIATLLAPVLVRLTAPLKSLPMLMTSIAPLAAWNEAVPTTVIGPFCEIVPPALMLRLAGAAMAGRLIEVVFSIKILPVVVLMLAAEKSKPCVLTSIPVPAVRSSNPPLDPLIKAPVPLMLPADFTEIAPSPRLASTLPLRIIFPKLVV